MRRLSGIILIGVIFVVGCSTTYYSNVFRVETTKPLPDDQYSSVPKDVIDGFVGSYFGWDWLARAVSTYESNDSTRLSRSSYSFTIQQVSTKPPAVVPKVDTLEILLRPGDVVLSLPLERLIIDSVSFGKEIRRILRFGSAEISPTADTLVVRMSARGEGAERETIEFRMVRYQATFEKFGFRARD